MVIWSDVLLLRSTSGECSAFWFKGEEDINSVNSSLLNELVNIIVHFYLSFHVQDTWPLRSCLNFVLKRATGMTIKGIQRKTVLIGQYCWIKHRFWEHPMNSVQQWYFLQASTLIGWPIFCETKLAVKITKVL